MDPGGRGARGRRARKFFAGVLGELKAFAAHRRKLLRHEQDGATYEQHLQRAAPHSAAARLELEGPALPAAGAYIWTWFLELASARGGNPAGLDPIGFADIDAWARLTGRRPTSWEVAALRALDATWLAPAEVAKEGGP